MLKLFVLSFLLNLSCVASGQTANRQYDSVISKVIERNTRNPECLDCDHTGICLLEITKKDTVVNIRTLYASSKLYDFGNDPHLLKKLKEKCKESIKGDYKVIVPMKFYFDEQEPSGKSVQKLQKKIKKLKHKRHVMETVYLTTYAASK